MILADNVHSVVKKLPAMMHLKKESLKAILRVVTYICHNGIALTFIWPTSLGEGVHTREIEAVSDEPP